MIVKMNLDGVIEKTYGSRVFKGSNAVTEIALFAPFDPQSTVIVNFTLPDGTEIPGIMTFADFSVEDHYNMWVYKLRQNVTSMEGRVTLSFEVRAYVDETEVTTTAETHIYIEKSSSTTFLDEVDEFFALANEALTRAQQALNLNRATNEALEIEIERNNEQDNAIAAINQTLISQQNVINEHGNELENLRQETNAQDQSINVLGERMSIAEQNIGVLNNKVNALPNPQDILTKQNYKMPEGYAPTQPHHLADKKYVDDVVEAMSGTNPEHFVTHAQLDEALEEALYKPDFLDLTITEPVYHITEATLDSPKEIQVIEGITIEVDGQLVSVKNPVIESVGKQIWDEQWEQGSIASDGALSIDAGQIRSKSYLQVNYEETISSSVPFNFVALYDKDRSFIERLAIGSYTFTNNNANAKYIKFTYLVENVPSDYKIMVNVGSQPLPYEPFRSTKLAINGEYHQWDRIINDGGVYYDEIGSVKVNLWEHENVLFSEELNTVYRFALDGFGDGYNIKLNDNSQYSDKGIINSIEPRINFFGDYRHWFYHGTLKYLYLFIEKPLIQAIMTRDSVDEVTAFKTYLEENNIVGVFQLATPTRKPTSITKAGDPDFSQGSTIYLHSDTEAIPTVHAKVAMDIAGQVNQLTKDSSNKSKKLHDHGQRIKANEIAIVDLEQAINDLNTEVSGINQTIANQVEGRIEQLEEALHDVEEALHDVEETLNLTQAELNQLQTDVSQVQENVTDIQNELDKKITLNSSYSGYIKEYTIGTILPVYATRSFWNGAIAIIKIRVDTGGSPIGFEETDNSDHPDRLNGTWRCIGPCGENYYLFQRLG